MKILQIIKYVFITVSVLSVASLFVMTTGDAANLMLVWAYILLAIAVAALIIMPLINLVKDPKGAVRSLVGLLALVVIAGICYALGSGETVIGSDGKVFDSAVTNRLSDMGLYMTYFALGVAIVVSVLGEIRNSFK